MRGSVMAKLEMTKRLLLAIAVGLALAGCNSAESAADAERQAMYARHNDRKAEQAAQPKTVVYRVTGYDAEIDVTYQNETGGTDQKIVQTPWEHKFTGNKGDFVYLSAQTDRYGSPIKAEILVDGTVTWKGETNREHGIASAKGSL